MAEQNVAGYSTPYKFTGKEMDGETGLYYYGARYYDPSICFFISVDALADEPEQIDKSPYVYAWNNPIKVKDPDGNLPIILTMALGGLVQGGIELGGQLINNGFNLREVDWVDVGVEAGKGVIKGSGAGLLAMGVAEVGGNLVKAGADYSDKEGHKNIFNDGKSLGAAAVDFAVDYAGGKAGDMIVKKSKSALKNSTKQLEKAAKKLDTAKTRYNSKSKGGAKTNESALESKSKLRDAESNYSNTYAKNKVNKLTNKVIKSPLGSAGVEAVENRTAQKLKEFFGINSD